MSLGIYVHIPFCVRKCDYCSFHSITSWNQTIEDGLIRKLLSDARLALSLRGDLSEAARAGTTIYIGGGTPSTLQPKSVSALAGGLLEILPAVREVTIEANPGSATREFLDIAGGFGVTRLSVGVQTFNRNLCRAIGRDYAQPERVAEIRRTWNGSLSADLIVGLPNQTTGAVLEDVQILVDIGVDHISAYDLSVDPRTPLSSRNPSGIENKVAWEQVCGALASAGLKRYEVSNFARPGHECLHNLGYWRMEPYLGLGPSAVSSFPCSGGGQRITQPSSLEAYMENHPLHGGRHEDLSGSELETEFFMLGLRMWDGLTRHRYKVLFGREWSQPIANSLSREVAAGLLVDDGRTIRPTNRGLDLLDSVLVRLVQAQSGQT